MARINFLDLPLELRIMVYELTLIFPEKLARRHHGRYHTEVGDDEEWHGFPPHMESSSECYDDACICDVRDAALLLVNQQIHKEAGSVFWSQNVHTCHDLETFGRFMGALRPEIKNLIRHVKICHLDQRNNKVSYEPGLIDTTWYEISQCKSLETLAIPLSMGEHDQAFTTHDLRKALPNLKSAGFLKIRTIREGQPVASVMYYSIALDIDHEKKGSHYLASIRHLASIRRYQERCIHGIMIREMTHMKFRGQLVGEEVVHSRFNDLVEKATAAAGPFPSRVHLMLGLPPDRDAIERRKREREEGEAAEQRRREQEQAAEQHQQEPEMSLKRSRQEYETDLQQPRREGELALKRSRQ
ncbi:hypothetical protein F4778DRAFT_746334 [Xylariomycetidae sp. FL2044]|nr:hypothetical protein F4778DRAFT_746334 [Xylariomycetidae sp. FL2044]